ncbi:head-tail adaptor protein [Levilactobacillus brevis]|uniref:phage head closure protein n=1 Tax=Levilactobacillus brevis TaxID=1580 RepID=UPI0021A8220C|nr:phage head closure protein [Levilactobacillus brevis]MCT3589317.1 head-tail adaptor protein [Levilactobacillus brevis]
MAKAINPSRMTFRLSFGSWVDGHVNPNTGESTKAFGEKFSCWAGQWSLNISQQMTMAGAGIMNAVVFFVRHNDAIKESMLVKRGEDLYQITNVSADDGLQSNGFDLITCQKDVKHG